MRIPKIFAVLIPAALLSSCGGTAEGPAIRRPANVLLVTIDTLRADRVSAYGGTAVPTPNIDRLAGRGTLFSRAYAPTPLTLPSHASILVGTTPVAHGVHDNINFVVRPGNETLAERLKAHGYRTAAVVSASPLDSRFGLDQGFDSYDDAFMAPGTPKTSPAEQSADAAVDKAVRWLGAAGDGPWFLWVHLWDPHAEYAPPEPFRTQYRDRPYDGEVAYTDSALGRLFGALDGSGSSERTLVVLTADHGEGLGDHGERTHGYLAYNSTLRVPLIVAAPGAGPSKSAEPVSHVDIVPTVLDLLGLEIPTGLQGRSLRPALAGRPLPARRLYFECLSPYYELGWAPIRGYFDGDDKYAQSPVAEVFNLAEDPGELKNLAATVDIAARESTLARLIAELTPAEPVDARARTSPELREKLESLGYLTRSSGKPRASFSADDDPKTLLPLLERITEAYELGSQGKREEAVRELEAAIREARTLDAAYIHLADLYRESGDRDRALSVLADGWRRFPSSYELLTTYVANLVSAGRWPDVVRVVGEASGLSQMDNDGIAWFFQGLAFQRLGDASGAVAAFEKAVAADGEFFDALLNLGAAHLALAFQTGDPAHIGRALPVLQRAVAVDPKNGEAHTLLGRAYLETGDADRAVSSLEIARSLRPDLANIEYQLGLAWLRKRDFSKAYTHLVSFRDKVYGTLSPEEKANLDRLIRESAAGR